MTNMNDDMMDKVSRVVLKEQLALLPESYQIMFKRMYADGKLEADINDIVDAMDTSKLKWATQQVQNSIKNGLKKFERFRKMTYADMI